MPSIIEIRKMKYLIDFNHNDFLKIYSRLISHKPNFNNDFFYKAYLKAINEKNIYALIQIAQMNIVLHRNIEAEYILTKAFEIDNRNTDLLYMLVDIFCRRHAIFHASVILKRFNNIEDYRYIISKLKLVLVTGINDIEDLIIRDFDRLKENEEFVTLLYDYSFRFEKEEILFLLVNTKIGHRILISLNNRESRISKRLMRKVLINRLRDISYE